MIRTISYLLVMAGVVFAARFALGQAGAPSDVLDEVITDQHGNTINHPISISIPEPGPGAVEGGIAVTVPPLTIDFHELNSPNAPISDRLHLDSYQVTIRSDDEIALAPRSGATFIPVAANERFLPIAIFAHSDSNQSTAANAESDHLHVVQGVFSGFLGKLVADVSFAEPVPEGTDVPVRFDFAIPPTMYDIAEAGIPGTNNIISDYVDFAVQTPNGPAPITGYFISSDDQSLYDTTIPVDGVVLEDGLFATDPGGPNPFYGGDLNFGLRFTSDIEVPEPGSIVLLAVGVASVVVTWRKRLLRSAPPMNA
jgi:hypothetical protein